MVLDEKGKGLQGL